MTKLCTNHKAFVVRFDCYVIMTKSCQPNHIALSFATKHFVNSLHKVCYFSKALCKITKLRRFDITMAKMTKWFAKMTKLCGTFWALCQSYVFLTKLCCDKWQSLCRKMTKFVIVWHSFVSIAKWQLWMLHLLPNHVKNIYPVLPKFALGQFHLHHDLCFDLELNMKTYANAPFSALKCGEKWVRNTWNKWRLTFKKKRPKTFPNSKSGSMTITLPAQSPSRYFIKPPKTVFWPPMAKATV